MKLIIFNGSSCSGKSSVIKNIMTEKDNYFHLNHDSIKWLFSKYESNRYYKDVHKVLLAIAVAVFEMKYNVLLDCSFYKSSRQEFIDLGKKYDYEILEINLEADYEVLLKRFNERVERALSVPVKDRRIANTSADRFKELFDIYNSEKNSSAITFKTDTETIEEVTGRVMKLL